MVHERNEICIENQRRLFEITDEHSRRLNDVERKVDVNENETFNVCKKLDDLTKALWGLTSAFIVGIIMLLIDRFVK